MGFDWIWLLSVWRTGPAAQQISRANPQWRHEFQQTLPDVRFKDLLGQADYAREGNDVASRGLYLDVAPWSFHVFDVKAQAM